MKISDKLKDLQAKRQAALDAADVIMKAADTAGEGLSAENAKLVDDHLADVARIGNEIEAIVRAETETAARAARIEEARKAAINPTVAKIVSTGPNMSDNPAGMEPKRFTIPARARSHQRITAFSSDAAGNVTAEEKAYRFGMYCLAKAARDLPGSYHFPHASRFANDQGLLNASHLEGGSDSTGSHLFVPEEFGTDLIMLREQYGVTRRLCQVRTMTSDTRTDPKWASGLTAYFAGEGEAATVSTQQFSQVRLTAKKLTALSTYSSELSEDAVIDIGNELAGQIAYAFSLKEDQCFINGDGTSTYGHIVGLRPSFATLTLGTAPGYLDTTTSNTWAAIVLADITKLISVVPVYAQQGMNFLCTSQFYYQVMVPLINASGGLSGTEMQGGFRTPIFQGIPVVFSQVMPTATATSSICLMLGNFAMAATLGDRRRMQFEFSKDATVESVSLFVNDLIAIKGTERIDINVHSFGSNTEAGPIVALSTGA